MGRKSLKEDRVEQILDAFDACLVEYGLQGVTLERVAKKAGLARRMILHYIGRKEDLIAAAVLRVSTRFKTHAHDFMAASNDKNRLEAGIDYLFSEDFYLQPDTRLVATLLPASLYEPKIKTAVNNDLLEVIFSDTGPGFTPELIHKIYQPFFTTKPYGTGMGLPISRSIVEAHDGNFMVRAPKYNKEGWVCFTLPIKKNSGE